MKILLICSAGTSTSLLVSNMKKAAQEQGKDYVIDALDSGTAKGQIDKYDVFLLGPQVKYMLKGFKELTDKPIDVIPPLMYGRVQGAETLKLAEDIAKK